MDPIQRLLIERECERLVYAYCHVIDHGEGAKVGEMFTEDGTWAAGPVLRDGKGEVTKAFQARQDAVQRMSRHVCSTVLIDVIDADNARGVTYVQLYRHDGEVGRKVSPLTDLPEVVGEYEDTFARTPAGWKFRTRKFVSAFVQAKPKS